MLSFHFSDDSKAQQRFHPTAIIETDSNANAWTWRKAYGAGE